MYNLEREPVVAIYDKGVYDCFKDSGIAHEVLTPPFSEDFSGTLDRAYGEGRTAVKFCFPLFEYAPETDPPAGVGMDGG